MTLTERIDELIEARGMSRRQLAIAADIPPSSLQSAMARGRNMTAEMVFSIAQTLHVSSDWLLGLSKDPSLSPIAVDDLGLSPKNVEYIRLLNRLGAGYSDTRLKCLNTMMENRNFDRMLSLCVRYISLMEIIPDLTFSTSSTYKILADELGKNGYTISLPEDQADKIFSERIVNLLRDLLSEQVKREEN